MRRQDKLTEKQRRFVELYESGSVTMKQAYRMAFDNYTAQDTTISPKASRLMAKKKVRRYQDALRRKAFEAILADQRAGCADFLKRQQAEFDAMLARARA